MGLVCERLERPALRQNHFFFQSSETNKISLIREHERLDTQNVSILGQLPTYPIWEVTQAETSHLKWIWYTQVCKTLCDSYQWEALTSWLFLENVCHSSMHIFVRFHHKCHFKRLNECSKHALGVFKILHLVLVLPLLSLAQDRRCSLYCQLNLVVMQGFSSRSN